MSIKTTVFLFIFPATTMEHTKKKPKITKKKVTKKKTPSASTDLPNCFIATPNGYEFKNAPKSDASQLEFLQSQVDGHIEPVLTTIKSCECFVNEEGMLRQLPFNAYGNPFIDKHLLLQMSISGGPFGNIIFYKKKGHESEELIKLAQQFDKKEDISDGEYESTIREFINKYLSEKK
jgi:hypothetical protein